MNFTLLFQIDEGEWDDAGRRSLSDFVRLVAPTPVKIKILNLFLSDPYLCLSSEYLGHRLGEEVDDVRKSARELSDAHAFSYCPSFAHSDLCCLSFASYSPTVQYCLRLWRLSLSIAPNFVWEQLDAADSQLRAVPVDESVGA